MSMDKKPSMGILAMLAPKGGSSRDEEDEDSGSMESEGKLSAAEDLIAALAKKDPQAVSDALEAHYACCSSEGDEEGPKSGRRY